MNKFIAQFAAAAVTTAFGILVGVAAEKRAVRRSNDPVLKGLEEQTRVKHAIMDLLKAEATVAVKMKDSFLDEAYSFSKKADGEKVAHYASLGVSREGKVMTIFGVSHVTEEDGYTLTIRIDEKEHIFSGYATMASIKQIVQQFEAVHGIFVILTTESTRD